MVIVSRRRRGIDWAATGALRVLWVQVQHCSSASAGAWAALVVGSGGNRRTWPYYGALPNVVPVIRYECGTGFAQHSQQGGRSIGSPSAIGRRTQFATTPLPGPVLGPVVRLPAMIAMPVPLLLASGQLSVVAASGRHAMATGPAVQSGVVTVLLAQPQHNPESPIGVRHCRASAIGSAAKDGYESASPAIVHSKT
jgi:hypothetical protein